MSELPGPGLMSSKPVPSAERSVGVAARLPPEHDEVGLPVFGKSSNLDLGQPIGPGDLDGQPGGFRQKLRSQRLLHQVERRYARRSRRSGPGARGHGKQRELGSSLQGQPSRGSGSVTAGCAIIHCRHDVIESHGSPLGDRLTALP